MNSTEKQHALIEAFFQIQQSSMDIDMLCSQYVTASMSRDEQKKQKSAKLILERAKLLLESAEKLNML